MGVCVKEYNEAPISVAMRRKPERVLLYTSPVATEMGVSAYLPRKGGQAGLAMTPPQ